jgi:hypothetical protein
MGSLTAWALAASLQVYRDVRYQSRPPVPSEFVASAAWFGILAVLDDPTQGVAGLVAWGTLIALVLEAGGPLQLVTSGTATSGQSPTLGPKIANATGAIASGAQQAANPSRGKGKRNG